MKTRRLVADILKSLSDNSVPSTWLIVGVGRTVSDLIHEHQSIERCLKQIEVPRMSRQELSEILDKGLARLQLSMDEDIRTAIIDISQGFPHYTHLLGKHTARSAILRGDDRITKEDFDHALQSAIDDAHESIRDAYQRATMSVKETLFPDLLLACALVKEDENGTFRASDLEVPLRQLRGARIRVTSYSYHLGQLCSPERGPILERLGAKKRHRYRFVNPLMKPFVLMKAYSAGRVRNTHV